MSLKVNDKEQQLVLNDGFAVISRTWNNGDVVDLNLPMPIRKVLAHKKIKDDVGKISLERGPIVYCAEWIDNGGEVLNLLLDKQAELRAEKREDMLSGITVLTGKATAVSGKRKKQQDFLAIPYYAWAHRGAGEMTVWFPYE